MDESSETSVCLYYTARHLFPEDGSLRSHGREKHMSQSVNVVQENNSRVYRERGGTLEHTLEEIERKSAVTLYRMNSGSYSCYESCKSA